MTAILSSPATSKLSQSALLENQLAKFDDKKHLLMLDDQQGVVVVSKIGLRGVYNAVLKRLYPKLFDIQHVAVRIISRGSGSTTLASNSGFQKFLDKCSSKQTSSKSYHAAHALLTLGACCALAHKSHFF